MIEMDEQFQKEFGAAMAQLRAMHQNLVRSAEHARDEARSISAAEEPGAAIPAYETSHAYWSAAERLRPVLGSFEDADRRAAQLMSAPVETAPVETDQSQRERADALAKVTSVVATLLGVANLEAIVPALRGVLNLPEVDPESLTVGTLLTGAWVGSTIPGRRRYTGRFEKIRPDGSVKIARICTICDDWGSKPHVVYTDLALNTVRLPEAAEIMTFDEVSQKTGLLRLPEASDE